MSRATDAVIPGKSSGSPVWKATDEQDFDKLCVDLGIEHRLTPPKSTQTHSMVERFNSRIEEVLQSHHLHSGKELKGTVHRYI